MIAARLIRGGPATGDAGKIEQALRRYHGREIQTIDCGGQFLAAASRDHVGKAAGVAAALTGWIDNAAELASELGVQPDNPAMLYAAALGRWGSAADAHVIGSYAAAAVLPDNRLHLARSPWDAPPLYYHCDSAGVIASPLLRVLFAVGVPREFDHDRMIDNLAYDWRSGEDAAWYRDVFIVPLGAHVRIEGAHREVNRWYEPPVPMAERDYREEEAVGQALALLDEAAQKALAWAGQPALTLSGGLDSPLVAASLVRALLAGARLPAITFVPDREWNRQDAPGTMGDERDLARLAAQAHPQIDWHLASNDIPPFDHRAREIFAAGETFAPGLANVAMYHRVYEKAQSLGCDSLLTADFGNMTFSESGYCAYTQYALSGHWRQLVRLLRNRPGDSRPLWRKLLAMSVLPFLPTRWRGWLRRKIHPARADMVALLTALSPDARAAQALRAAKRGTGSAWADFTCDLTRKQTVARDFRDADGPGRDIDLAFEQLYNLRKRDVTTYRPLVEFCMGLPARAFAWDGLDRRLARLMGRRRVPDAIRVNRLHGQHNADWHARLTRERDTLAQALLGARTHPFLGQALDIERLSQLLEDWPDAPDFSWEQDWPRMLALPRALLAARFIGYLENRNDL